MLDGRFVCCEECLKKNGFFLCLQNANRNSNVHEQNRRLIEKAEKERQEIAVSKQNVSPKSVNKLKISTIFSFGLLISFFLPWIDVIFWQFSAFEIPMRLDSIAHFLELFGENMVYLKLSYLLYLIPCSSIYNIINDLLGKEKSFIINLITDEFDTGLLFIILLFILFNGQFEVFGVGYYLTAAFSVLGSIFTFNNRK